MLFVDLVIPAPPLPVPLGDRGGLDDPLPPLPPPADYDTTPQSLEKGLVSVAATILLTAAAMSDQFLRVSSGGAI